MENCMIKFTLPALLVCMFCVLVDVQGKTIAFHRNIKLEEHIELKEEQKTIEYGKNIQFGKNLGYEELIEHGRNEGLKQMVNAEKLTGKYRDCHERWKSGEVTAGVYVIYPNGSHPMKVYCNHSVEGTFTVIQRRVNGLVSFYRHLNDYQLGFGNAQGDYWAGLDNIHHLTSSGNNKLTIHMSDWHGNNRYATYEHFLVLDHNSKYQMHISGFSGNVADDMSHSNGMYFTTPDYPDAHSCAINMKTGWWFNYCAFALPNGHYYNGGSYKPGQYYDGIFWKDWMGFGYSLKFISMSLYH